FAENFNCDLVVCAQDVTGGRAYSGRQRCCGGGRRGTTAGHARNRVGRTSGRFSRSLRGRGLREKRAGRSGDDDQEGTEKHELEGKRATNSELIIVKTE